MASTAQLVTARATAVADYATALDNFKTAYVSLAALDRVLMNNLVGHAQVMPSFGPLPDVIALRHPDAAPNIQGDWAAEIGAAMNAHMAAWPTPEE